MSKVVYWCTTGAIPVNGNWQAGYVAKDDENRWYTEPIAAWLIQEQRFVDTDEKTDSIRVVAGVCDSSGKIYPTDECSNFKGIITPFGMPATSIYWSLDMGKGKHIPGVSDDQ